eukprot:TRINITY_DN2871_c0_g1_i1.p1 TRINITY_DN2871_c0_g1~~TRINITY_DN2871_c0_g1_i1.p1  ORF type:complete len:364 (+),score=78.48 TRINITY_DN2871_c0_g1_i1:72-1094(+)
MSSSPRLQDLVSDAGRALGRSRDEVKPFLRMLEDNWYDSVDSLRDASAGDLQELGLPQRFAKELLLLAQQAGSGGRRGSRDSSPPPVERRKSDKGKGSKGKSDKGKDGKSKGKGDYGKSDSRDYRSRDSDRDSKGTSKGKSKDSYDDNWTRKGKGKGSKDKDEDDEYVRPSQREYAHTHKITFDIEELDESFPLGARIIGRSGANTRHIHDTTGAWVWLCGKGSGNKDGKDDEPLHVVVQSDDLDSLNEGIEATNDLVDTVLAEYAEHTQRRENGQKDSDDHGGCFECGEKGHFARECPKLGRKGKGKGKSKDGKGKSKRDRDDGRSGHSEPPLKRQRRD